MPDVRTTSVLESSGKTGGDESATGEEGYAEWSREERSFDWLLAVVICLLPLAVFVGSCLSPNR